MGASNYESEVAGLQMPTLAKAGLAGARAKGTHRPVGLVTARGAAGG